MRRRKVDQATNTGGKNLIFATNPKNRLHRSASCDSLTEQTDQLALLTRIVDQLETAIVTTDKDLMVTGCNRAAAEMLGCPANAAIGRSLARFLGHRPDASPLVEYLESNAFSSTGHCELRLEGSDGHPFFARISCTSQNQSDGAASGFIIQLKDLSRERKERSRLMDSEKRFRELAEHTPVGIFMAGHDGDYIYVNEFWEKLSGLTRKSAMGSGWQSVLHPDDVKSVMKAWKQFLSHASSFAIEYRFVRDSGETVWVASSAVPYTNQAGQVIGFLGSATEISHHKQFELELEISRDQAQRANQAKSEFLSKMSHELRTPLNAILGFGQLLQLSGENLDAEQIEIVTHILEGGEHLLHLIEDILDLSRLDSGRMNIDLQKFETGKIIQRSVSLVSSLAWHEEISIVQPTDPLPAVIADESRLQQVLVNLLSNAIKYNRSKGTVTILCDLHAPSEVRISVRDTGRGIPLQDQDRLFEPFVRGTDPHVKAEGTGIGLSICKNLAERMGGSIGFESEPGIGSTFWIDLPSAAELGEPGASEVDVKGLRRSAGLEGIRMLYMEDQLAGIRALTKVTREIPGCQLFAASNGLEGVNLAKSTTPGIIFVDTALMAPSALDVLEKLKNDERTCHIPTVGLGCPDDLSADENESGVAFDRVLPRSLNLDDLFEVIRALYLRPSQGCAEETTETA